MRHRHLEARQAILIGRVALADEILFDAGAMNGSR
jgi:hypothetical protein